MTAVDLVAQVKANLLITFDDDDTLIGALVNAATSYATSYQHLPEGHYEQTAMSGATRQGIVMLASHFYESRDGSTAGFWADKPDAAKAVWDAVNNLLRLDRNWKV
ncbi:head-tail connector protein [Corynebacterium silvaticum]|uniref:Head-tail connector protein n=1 Tax=Corynebacterium silvaticum TaxID=2320431 RepID=A0A7Y4LI02_9CORY|nr:head-tail connector protein [Corynebacterium silvaticum]ARU45735.1 head-tail connector protein [Corynebacterium silvaticum]NON70300.1 phage gp6-like head-tail connector protein [Corynebacterium silvaticum]UWH00850.1 head-tail connector protein [Corynebacterium silvaticum]UWH02897.1 head-tail connector protein [Corynebacterium silvaticum]UWH04937.1 head-tail connector protein [Corynebacterium silvaticum]